MHPIVFYLLTCGGSYWMHVNEIKGKVGFGVIADLSSNP